MQKKLSAWMAGILGIWTVAAAFLGFFHVVILVSNLAVGIALVIVGVGWINKRMWQGWILFLFSFWLCLSGYLVDLHFGTDLILNNGITGLVISLAGWSQFLKRNKSDEN